MAVKVYRIRDWEECFEKLTFEMKRPKGALKWVAIPTKHDGKSYRRLMKLENAAETYGAWVLIVAVASKCPIRGTLSDSDGPLTPEDLEYKTGLASSVFESAIEVLLSERVKWLEEVEFVADRRGSSRIVADSRQTATTERDYTTPQDITIQDTTPQTGGGVSRKFSLWKKATREQILCPSGAQRVFQLATGVGLCTIDERLHIFRLICSLTEANGNLPAILTSVLRGDAGKDPWRARGGDFEQQAKEWIRKLDVPAEMQERTSDLSTGPPTGDLKAEMMQRLAALDKKKREPNGGEGATKGEV